MSKPTPPVPRRCRVGYLPSTIKESVPSVSVAFLPTIKVASVIGSVLATSAIGSENGSPMVEVSEDIVIGVTKHVYHIPPRIKMRPDLTSQGERRRPVLA
jgi:hypothetical protein